MNKTMLVVGAGIAGLSTGYYARLNGFDVTILESGTSVGGLCASWKRKGYTFDTSMHMLSGSKFGPFHRMWQELGVIEGRRFHYHDRSGVIEWRDGKLELSIDPASLLRDLREISPLDTALSKEFVRLLSRRSMMAAGSLKAPELYGPFDYLKMLWGILPLLGVFRKYGKTTIEELASSFRSPKLREAVRFMIDSPGWAMHRYPAAGLAGFFNFAVRESGAPIGGSHEVVETIAGRFRELGGRIQLHARVADIIVEEGRAVGVRTSDGRELRGDILVWAADGHHLIFDLLGGKYLNEEIRLMYAEWIPVQPIVQIMLGVDRDLSSEPPRILRELDEQVEIAGEPHRWMCIVNRSFDATAAPAGKSVLEVWYASRFDYWEALAHDRKRYLEEKNRLTELTIGGLEKRWPGIRGQIEVVEVATPATYHRLTGNWQGSPDGWSITVENMGKRTILRKLPGLESLYLVGQWTAPFTGTVVAALTGRQLVEILCRKEGGRFVTSRARAVEREGEAVAAPAGGASE